MTDETHMAMLNWPASERYRPDFRIGSEDEDGSHRRDTDGWPYSLYLEGAQCGVTDCVLAHGIQNLDDAKILARMLRRHHYPGYLNAA